MKLHEVMGTFILRQNNTLTTVECFLGHYSVTLKMGVEEGGEAKMEPWPPTSCVN